MAALSDTITPQGLLAVVPFPPSPPLRSLQAPGYALVLDGLRDPGNLGTVMRSAAALECSEIIIVACCDPLSHKAIRASMGAVFRVPWRTCQHFEDALSVLSVGSELFLIFILVICFVVEIGLLARKLAYREATFSPPPALRILERCELANLRGQRGALWLLALKHMD
eukprot:c18582_g1_i2.p2 GENE.c18582_g1_i2~~c18582_g1_i2.p2  ORF type:complete len:168 (+),score=31.44 c18582_g1_i2:406-909(+)